MLKNIDLANKCGSCDHFKPIENTATGECLQNPYNDSVVHDPKHPHWIVQRSRIKCPLYNAKTKTNADRIRAMSDEELAEFIRSMVDEDRDYDVGCYGCINYGTHHSDPENKGTHLYECDGCLNEGIGLDIVKWLQQPAQENIQ
jgi:hypothetical protein